MDANAAAQQLLQNQKFVELFQRALGKAGKDGDNGVDNLLASMPKEDDPKREAWLRSLQARLQEETAKEAKKDLEQVHSDENGQWMFVLPEPGFCIKTNVAGGAKIFINVCQHVRIAEPVPMDAGPGSDGEVRYRVPISCGQARPDKDKSGKPCKVYDVIVNPSTIQRCGEDNEFRRFVAALCMQWIKQKSEPTLNADEFRNLNFRCKGTLEPQRIRLSTKPKEQNAMGDEIQLPSSANAATAPSQPNGAQGTGKMVQEVQPRDVAASTSGPSGTPPSALAPSATPAVKSVVAEGSYDWTAHTKAALNPYFKENVPASYVVSLFLPGIQTIREVDVRVCRRHVECVYVDDALEENDGAAAATPFLTATLDYPVSDEVVEAKYVRKTNTLRLRVAVQLPDETQTSATRPERDVTEIEEEEQRRVQEAKERQWEAAKAQRERREKEEAAVMRERRSYVENLSAVQAGDVPPVVREEVDAMPREQLPSMLSRLEGRIRKGDSVDVLLNKLPEPMLEALIDYIREKLSLEPRPKHAAAAVQTNVEPVANARTARKGDMPAKPATGLPSPGQEFNVTKQSEALFGVAFHNRYLFALD
ncbi:PIH1 N-terminal domain/PIH1 CS-like domain containing protein [Lotmaria passim]